MVEAKNKQPVFWFTGLSGVGKTTLAKALSAHLTTLHIANRVLDGDELRAQLWPELGFSKEDRELNVTRTCQLAKELQAQGFVVIVSLISPYQASRERAIKELQGFEIYLEAPLEILKARDPKGLYAKAITGELKELSGVSAPYEKPVVPDFHFRTDLMSVTQCINKLFKAAYL